MIRDKNPSLVARLFGKGEVWSGCKAGTTKRKSFPEHREKQDLRVTRKKVLPEGGADMRKLNPKRYKNGDRGLDFTDVTAICHTFKGWHQKSN